MNSFRKGDRVTWKPFIGRALSSQHGRLWNGPDISPRGYKINAVEGEELLVETNEGEIWEHYANFSLIKPHKTRNLPEWW